MHHNAPSKHTISPTLSLMRKNKRVITFLATILLIFLLNSIYAGSIYNSDFKPHRVQIEYKDGSQYFVTVYNSASHYFDCNYGCQVKLVRTGYTRTLASDAVVIIDDGKLRVR